MFYINKKKILLLNYQALGNYIKILNYNYSKLKKKYFNDFL